MESDKHLSIGEAARLAGNGVSAKMIRHWIEKGYLAEPERVVCGERSYRKFGLEDVERIKRIRFYVTEGFRVSAAAEKAAKDFTKKGGGLDA